MKTPFGILLGFLFAITGAASALAQPEKPNVLFIAVDDMNDWVGPLGGYEGAITPNLDRLAKMGVTFTNAHTPASACHPSRVAVMTGVRPSRSGITTNIFNQKQGPSWRNVPCLKNAVTLSQIFRDDGYHAAACGKIYHSLQWGHWDENDPATWDEIMPGNPRSKSPIPFQPRPTRKYLQSLDWFGRRPLGDLFMWAPLQIPDTEMADHATVTWAAEQLANKREKPLFLAAGIFRPHMPWEVPQKYFDLYPLDEIRDLKIQENDLADAWDHGRRYWHQFVLQNDQWKHVVRAYLASITYADAELGRLLDALEKSPIKDNTVIAFWSDHGMHIGEKENWEKFTVWEESTRIPMFVVAPGVTEGGTRCAKPVSSLDLYPTLCELAGIELPEDQIDGESLVPLLKDPENGPREQPAITGYRQHNSVRSQHHRYIVYGKSGDGRLEELYDHRSDPNEFTNLAYDREFAGVLTSHRALLKKHTGIAPPNTSSPPPAYELSDDGRVRRREFLPMDNAVQQAHEAKEKGNPIPLMGRVPKPKAPPEPKAAPAWIKHTIQRPALQMINSAVANDWDKDGQIDVLSSFEGKVILFKGPGWKPHPVFTFEPGKSRNKPRGACIHSCLLDVDADGDLDFIGSNNTVFWLECPDDPFSGKPWTYRTVDDEILGTHCLITGDVNKDGRLDLIANSGRTEKQTEFPQSLTWLEIPANPKTAKAWERHVFADKDAPGGSHYAGFGDVNKDGRPDIAYGAKGGKGFDGGEWFAWWEQPEDPAAVWKKHSLPGRQPGATNIIPADLDADGHVDYFATRGHGKGALLFKGPGFKPVEVDPDIVYPHSLALADIDGDGDTDAVTCGKEADGVAAWYQNDGKGNFTKHVIGTDQGSYDTRTVDMDGDGDLDVLIAGHASRNIVWFENPQK